MKRTLLSTVSLLFCVLAVGCGGTSASLTDGAEPLPDGAFPFDYHRGHLYFDARFCDSFPARLIFDTGAVGLHVDSLWLVCSGWSPRRLGRANIEGAGSQRKEVQLILDTLSFDVDTLHLESRMTSVLDLKAIAGRQADGIFGLDYLNRFADSCVLFDLRRGYMRAVNPDTLADAGFRRFPLEKQGDFLLVDACVRFDDERIVDGRFLFDMGCGTTLIVNTPAAREADFSGYAGPRVHYATIAGGVGGESEADICRAATVDFGGRTFAAVPVSVSCDDSGYLAREDVKGVIGTQLLDRFVFAVDFVTPALWLRRTEACDERFSYETAGFTMIDRTDICDGWVVTGLYDNIAPAALRPGDVVVGWDGEALVSNAHADSLMRVSGRHRIEVKREGKNADYDIEIKEVLVSLWHTFGKCAGMSP